MVNGLRLRNRKRARILNQYLVLDTVTKYLRDSLVVALQLRVIITTTNHMQHGMCVRYVCVICHRINRTWNRFKSRTNKLVQGVGLSLRAARLPRAKNGFIQAMKKHWESPLQQEEEIWRGNYSSHAEVSRGMEWMVIWVVDCRVICNTGRPQIQIHYKLNHSGNRRGGRAHELLTSIK